MNKRIWIIGFIFLAIYSNFVLAAFKNTYKTNTNLPCPQYAFLARPYVGISAGYLINTTGKPTAYEGLAATLSAGWSTMITSSVYLGAEIALQNNLRINNYKFDDSGTQSTWGYAINVLPGYMLTDYVLGYLRLGGARTHFNGNNTFGDQNLTGWQLGIGGQTNLHKQWDIRAEYIYTGYNTLHGRGNVQTNLFNVGVIYKFI